jgi:hypothetical protein
MWQYTKKPSKLAWLLWKLFKRPPITYHQAEAEQFWHLDGLRMHRELLGYRPGHLRYEDHILEMEKIMEATRYKKEG